MIRALAAAAAAILAATAPYAMAKETAKGMANGVASESAAGAQIAIIIDDLGYRRVEGLRALRLPGPVAVAILPGTPQAVTLAEAANARDKEVLVHLPLQASVNDGLEEPGSIGLDTGRGAFRASFNKALASIPHASGVNNHRGSLLTRHPGHMRWLMEDILAQESDLFFIDSFTTHKSVALAIAGEQGVPALKRDVFLDSDRSPESIAREFERLKRLARKQGAAIGIGHPFPETLDFLEAALPGLEAEGIRLVPVRQLFDKKPPVLAPQPTIIAAPPVTPPASSR